MSQPPNTGSGRTAVAAPVYFCHQCECAVDITPSSELTCARCNGSFIEELENPNPNPNSFFTAFDDASGFSPFGGFPLIFSRSGGGGGGGGGGGMEIQNIGDLSALFGPGPMSRPGGVNVQNVQNVQNPGGFNSLMFVQNYLNQLREGGANIQFVIENQSDGGGLGLDPFRSSFGDYYFGPGLEQLIQQLAENDPNRYGTPPAAKSAVEKLPNVKISKELLESDYSDCAVCKDSFGLDEEVKQLPCKHMYHPDCILPWLKLHNSCPVCRFELPTDDPDYENRSRQASSGVGGGSGGGGGGSVGGSQGNPPTPRTLERRFRINLPWPFPGYGARAETSNSGSGNNNSGDGNQGTGGGGGGGGQARQEDLD